MQRRRLGLSAVQVMASVAAAMTGALAASYLGIAGTIIGAAVASFATTVGTALYLHVLGQTRDRLRSAAGRAVPRAGSHSQAGNRTPAGTEPAAVSATAPAGRPGEDADPAPGRKRGTGGGSRGLVLAGAVAVTFVVTMALITVIELAVGKPLDSIIWHRPATGTTVGNAVTGRRASPRGTRHAVSTPPPRPRPATPASWHPASWQPPASSPRPARTAPAVPARPASPAPSPSPSPGTSSQAPGSGQPGQP